MLKKRGIVNMMEITREKEYQKYKKIAALKKQIEELEKE